jgi:hypothetical protein
LELSTEKPRTEFKHSPSASFAERRAKLNAQGSSLNSEEIRAAPTLEDTGKSGIFLFVTSLCSVPLTPKAKKCRQTNITFFKWQQVRIFKVSMKMYLLQCKVAPVTGGVQEKFGGAYGGVWVWTDSRDRVENAAEEYLLKYSWMLEEREGIHEVSLDDAKADPIHLANYIKAQKNGAAAELTCFERHSK